MQGNTIVGRGKTFPNVVFPLFPLPPLVKASNSRGCRPPTFPLLHTYICASDKTKFPAAAMGNDNSIYISNAAALSLSLFKEPSISFLFLYPPFSFSRPLHLSAADDAGAIDMNYSVSQFQFHPRARGARRRLRRAAAQRPPPPPNSRSRPTSPPPPPPKAEDKIRNHYGERA